MGWLRGTLLGARALHRASERVADGVAAGVANAAVKPSRMARRTGVLAPGDPPPAGVRSGYLDYRGVALPSELGQLHSGLFPIGRMAHPQRGAEVPGWMSWDQVIRHTAVIGPAGSGKTTSLLVPWIISALRAGIAVVAVDVKGDLREEIKAQTASRGAGRLGLPLFRWDIADPRGSRPWNPLAEIHDSQSLNAVVTALLDAIDPTSKDRYFAERDHRWLRGLLRLALAVSPKASLVDVLAMTLDRRRLDAALATSASHGAELGDLAGYAESDYSLATGGLANRLSWVADRDVADLCSYSSFSLEEILSQPSLCIVGARLSHGEPAAAAAATMLGLLRVAAFGRFGQPSQPMLWVIDEAAVVASRVDLPRLLEVARGAGVGVVVALQDVTQLGDRDARNRQLANCHGLIVLRGCSAETAEHFAGRLGVHSVATTGFASDHRGRALPTVGREQLPVLGTREIMHPPLGQFAGVGHIPSVSARPFLLELS